MRWSNLAADVQDRARLPGYRDEAVVRHFEAPGAIQTRFYEVRAKSILNRVPEASAVPFRWTINPYRGCTHACTYCLHGETPVLTGDGRHKPIMDVRVGEEIYGTSCEGRHRKYVRTAVLDKWVTVKPAYRVTLEDGTELLTSADHRLLTNRGWNYVANAVMGEGPHLTTRTRLVGTGAFASQPTETRDYRRGYLCGIIRGGGHAEFEALRRARDYLARDAAQTRQPVLQPVAVAHGKLVAVATGATSQFELTQTPPEWPLLPSPDWCRGFLAGIFDVDGLYSALALRIASADSEVLAWTEACARRLGLDAELDPPSNGGLACVRIVGGLPAHLRFFHLTDPAITRKRSIEGQAVKTSENLRVVAIEALDQLLPLCDITTGTGDFIADGVVSHNCFARPTHKYLDFDAGRDFEREIVVKVNAPELLRAELARSSWKGEHVALGTNTDPYQWVEGRYKLMPGIWEAMRDAANPCSILTKSPLLLRDLGIMREISQRTDFSAAVSVPTLDERAWRATEPHTPNPRARLEAVAELTRAGIRTGVLVAPLMPGVNDAPEQVAAILELASEAGADYVTGIALHLRGDVKGLFFDWLRQNRPDLLERYEDLYRRGAYAPLFERNRLARLVKGADLAPGERMRGRMATGPLSNHARKEVQERLF